MLVKLASGHPLGNSSQYIPVGQGFSLLVVQAQQILKSFSKIVKDCLLKKIR
jgi:hypothetical protein